MKRLFLFMIFFTISFPSLSNAEVMKVSEIQGWHDDLKSISERINSYCEDFDGFNSNYDFLSTKNALKIREQLNQICNSSNLITRSERYIDNADSLGKSVRLEKLLWESIRALETISLFNNNHTELLDIVDNAQNLYVALWNHNIDLMAMKDEYLSMEDVEGYKLKEWEEADSALETLEEIICDQLSDYAASPERSEIDIEIVNLLIYEESSHCHEDYENKRNFLSGVMEEDEWYLDEGYAVLDVFVTESSLWELLSLTEDFNKYASKYDSFKFMITMYELELLSVMSFIDSETEYEVFVKNDIKQANCEETLSEIVNNDYSSEDFSKCDLSNMHFVGGNFKDTIFDSAILRNTIFEDALFSNTSFENANLSEAVLIGNDLSDSKFDKSNLENADISGTKGKNTSFRSANLKNANLSEAYFSVCDFSNADMQNSDLRNATFFDTTLYGMDITGANIEGTKWMLVLFDYVTWIDGHKCAEHSYEECN